MSIAYYIYYRAKPSGPDDLREKIKAMQEALRNETGIAGSLHCHCDQPDTWMEIYPGVTNSQAFEAALAQAVKAHGIQDLLEPDTTRHTERFTAL